MKRLLLLFLLPGLAWADAPQLQVEAQLEPSGQVMVGSTVRLEVTVFTDTWFTSAPQLEPLQLPGALVQAPGGEAEKYNKQQNGKTLFGLRYAYLISPNQAQVFAIPALAITATPGQATAPITVHSLPLNFTAQLPPGFAAGEPVLVANALRLSQRIIRPDGELKVGDSLVRELTLEADGAQAMLLPPPVQKAVDGLSAFPAAPRIEPISDGRGGFTGGRRIDSISYRVDQSGNFTLPAIELNWWDNSSQQKRTVSVPAVDFKASANAGYKAPFSITADLATLGQNRRLHLTGYWLVAIAAVLMLLLIYTGRPWWRRARAAWQRQREARRLAWLASADYAWQQVPGQLQQQPPQLTALYQWLRRSAGFRTFVQVPLPPAKRLLGLLNQRYAQEGQSASIWPVSEPLLPELRSAVQPAQKPQRPALQPLNPRHAKDRP